jgi:hypothetical protein
MDVTFQIIGIAYSNVASRRSRQSLVCCPDRSAPHAVSPYAGDRLNDGNFGYDTCTGYRR